VLLVEDNPGDARLIQEYLKNVTIMTFELSVVGTLEKAQKMLEEGIFDLVLLDLGLPDSAGLDTVTEVIGQVPSVPVVVLTGLSDDERAMESINRGAQDYLVKDMVNSDMLIRSIRYSLHRKQAQLEIEQVADTAQLYLDIMSHDMRNQLQAIVMASEIMEFMDLDMESKLAVEIITESSAKSQKLINKVLSTRDLLSVPLSDISLKQAIENSLMTLKDDFDDVLVNSQYHVENSLVQADKFIEQLLLNILENAVEYSERETREVWIELKEKRQGYQISIMDNGPGISDQRKESLFDPSRRFGGVGIHQSIRILKKYRGHMSIHDRVVSDPSQGAEFRIWLPKAPSAKSKGT